MTLTFGKLTGIAAALLALAGSAMAISDPELDTGAGWTSTTGGSGLVTFTGTGLCRLTAFLTSSAGIEQQETPFTAGQEWQLDVKVDTNGNVEAGWRAGSPTFTNGATTVYANGATGVRQVKTDDPLKPLVFVEKVGSIGGIIDIDYMRTSVITAAPTWPVSTGVVTAVRTSATGADLGWASAIDNVSPAGDIVYRIYWSTVSANVITDGVKQTAPGGSTFASVSGLPASAQVFFTIRAEDRVGNRDTNTVQVSIPASAAVAGWEMY